MHQLNTEKRFAYCKYADVVSQLSTLGPCPEHVPDGGPDTYAANFLRLSCGNPVLLISYTDKDATTLTSNKVTARTFNMNSKHPILEPFTWLWLFFSTFILLLRFSPTHILCAASNSPLWACFLISRIKGIPLVHTRHAALSENPRSPAKRFIEYIDAFVIRRASAVICHGPYLRAQMLSLGVSADRLYEFNISYKYLISNTNAPAHEIYDLTDQGKNRCILFVGRAYKEKGIMDLFNACKDLLHSRADIRLVYIGEGPHLKLLNEQVVKEGLTDRVITLGHIAHNLLPFLIKQGHCLVTPTQSSFPESRCKAAIEGMILGKPVIAPEFGPFPYVFKHGHNGLLYTPDSVEDLRDKITAVINDDALYSRLVKGAKEETEKLLDASLSFRQALDMAFKCK